MKKLPNLHDKVKYHRYRDDIIVNAAYYKGYIRAFNELLDAFQKEIDSAGQTPIRNRTLGERMLIEMDNRCFMIDAWHKLTHLSSLAADCHARSDSDTEHRIRILMAQLEGTLSSIHEYIVYGKVSFILRYPNDDSMEVIRLCWRQTDYAPI